MDINLIFGPQGDDSHTHDQVQVVGGEVKPHEQMQLYVQGDDSDTHGQVQVQDTRVVYPTSYKCLYLFL
jgi:hypothetical protein